MHKLVRLTRFSESPNETASPVLLVLSGAVFFFLVVVVFLACASKDEKKPRSEREISTSNKNARKVNSEEKRKLHLYYIYFKHRFHSVSESLTSFSTTDASILPLYQLPSTAPNLKGKCTSGVGKEQRYRDKNGIYYR